MMGDPGGDDSSREQTLHDVLAAYFEAAENGDDPDRRILLDRHPELAAELADYFAVQDEVHHMAVPLRAVANGRNGGDPSELNPIELLFGMSALSSVTSNAGLSFGDYELQGVIARGGMGIVFRARQRSLNRLVALKVIRDGASASAEDARRFRNEAEAVAHLDHPHIVPIHEVGEERGFSFFTMKLVEGGNLAERLKELQDDPRAAARLMATVARAVHHAHERGILHRDLKPSNILIDDRGEPLVADFGLARRVEGGSELTQTGAVLGTPSYMAPEQATGRRGTVTKAADIHGLGAILYAVLTGRPPFRGETPLETLQQVRDVTPQPPSTIRQAIDHDLETICLKCLEKEPERRYASALAVAEDIERWLVGRSILARQSSRVERAWRLCRRNPRMSAMAVTMLLLVVSTANGLVGATRARHTATRLSNEIRRNEHAERSRQYVRDVRHASQLWADNRPAQALEILDRYRPALGEDDLRGFAWHYFHRVCSVGQETLSGHEGEVYYAVFSPDGKTLATASQDKTVRLWDVETRTTRLVLVGHEDEINWVSFSPDGRSLATASDDHQIKLWNAETGRIESTLAGHQEQVVAAVFTADGQRVVSGDRKGKVIRWDVVSGRECGSFSLKNGTVQSLAISPDGTVLAVAGKRVVIWNLVKGQEQLRLDAGANGLAFSRDGTHLAAAAGREVKVWETQTWQVETSLRRHPDDIESVAFGPDDHTLASVDGLGVIRLWDRVTGAGELISSGQDRLWCVAFAPDGRSLATTSKGGGAKLWDVERDRARIPISLPTVPNTSFAFSAERGQLVVADDRGSVWTIDMNTGHKITAMPFDAGRSVRRAALSGDAGTLVTARDNRCITLWNLASGRHIGDFSDVAPTDNFLATDGKGEWIARCVKLGLFQICSASGVRRAQVESAGADRLVFSPRQDSVSIAGWSSNRPTLFNRSARTLRTAQGPGHRSYITAQAYSLDGTTLATAGDEGAIVLWDVATLDPLLRFQGQTADVESLAFTPDARTVASGTRDGLVRLWDVPSGLEIVVLEGHTGPVRHVRFTDDGLTLATCADAAGGGSEVFLWRATAADSAANRPEDTGGCHMMNSAAHALVSPAPIPRKP